jgi:hypothetical protein
MKRNIALIIAGCVFFALVNSGAQEPAKPSYFIRLLPEPASGVYTLKLNSAAKFSVQGFRQAPKPEEPASSVQPSRIWWQYDWGILEKVRQDKDSITLRAIKPGITKLRLTVNIKSQRFCKTITIVVKK